MKADNNSLPGAHRSGRKGGQDVEEGAVTPAEQLMLLDSQDAAAGVARAQPVSSKDPEEKRDILSLGAS